MEIVLHHRGRAVTAGELATIRRLIAAHPDASRRQLSQLLCELWSWRQANGALRDMVCRSLLLALERTGQIVLPAPRRRPPNNAIARRRPAAIDLDRTPLRTRLEALGPLAILLVPRRSDAERLFDGLLAAHHYLGYAPSRPARPFHRLVAGRAAAQPALPRLQHALPDPSLGRGAAARLARPGADRAPGRRGLGAALRPPGLLPRDLRRSVAVPGHLLPGGELDRAGADDRPGPGRPQPPAEPAEEGGARLPALAAVPGAARAGSRRRRPKRIDLGLDELGAILERAASSPLAAD